MITRLKYQLLVNIRIHCMVRLPWLSGMISDSVQISNITLTNTFATDISVRGPRRGLLELYKLYNLLLQE